MSKDKDFGISPVGSVNGEAVLAQPLSSYVNQNIKKLNYLIVLSKGKTTECFVTFGKLDFVPGFVLAKGFFSELSPEETIKNIDALLTSFNKDLVYEMYLPVHRIEVIQSCVYKHK